MNTIKVIGLGPGDFGYITLECWELMQEAKNLYLRTAKHPTVPMLQQRGITFATYDSFYEEAEDFAHLYEKIAKDIVTKALSGMDIVMPCLAVQWWQKRLWCFSGNWWQGCRIKFSWKSCQA